MTVTLTKNAQVKYTTRLYRKTYMLMMYTMVLMTSHSYVFELGQASVVYEPYTQDYLTTLCEDFNGNNQGCDTNTPPPKKSNTIISNNKPVTLNEFMDKF